jgi:hypothetical protein
MHERDEAFFEDIASALDSWTETTSERLLDPSGRTVETHAAFEVLADALDTPETRGAFEHVVRDTLTGFAHSVMVTLDGGSTYSDAGAPQLFHNDGRPFVSGLHEWFFDHLGRTGRLP